MRILHYVQSTDSRHGGVPRFVLDDSRVMAAQGHPSTILTHETIDTPAAWLEEGASATLPRVERIGAGPGGVLRGEALRVARAELAKADVLHLHCVWSLANLQLAAMARSLGVPYVLSLHGMLDDWSVAQKPLRKRAYMGLAGRHMLEKAAFVHSTASAELAQSKRWFPRGTETIIPYLMDLDPYRTLPGKAMAREKFEFLAQSADPTVLFLSRLHYKKGCEFLLEAAALLRDRGVACRVAFAGTGDEPYVRTLSTMSEQLGLADRVHFLGQVRGVEKFSLYQNADLFVLPTSQENFGLVLIESLACGTPVVTTKGVDIWQDVEASGAAAIVDQAAEPLADCVARLLGDNDLRVSMGEKARPWVFSTYDESMLIGRYERFYADAAGTAAAASRREAVAWDRALAGVGV